MENGFNTKTVLEILFDMFSHCHVKTGTNLSILEIGMKCVLRNLYSEWIFKTPRISLIDGTPSNINGNCLICNSVNFEEIN